MLDDVVLNFLRHLAKGLADQFGPNCEVVIHDLSDNYKENSIVAIENGHVTNRKVGDGPSMAVLDALRSEPDKLQDHTSYLTKTKDGRILKSTTIYIRNENQKVIGIFSINYDITELMMVENAIKPLISVASKEEQVSPIPQNVTDLLNELIEESTRQVGKPVPLMTREDCVPNTAFLKFAWKLLAYEMRGLPVHSYYLMPNVFLILLMRSCSIGRSLPCSSNRQRSLRFGLMVIHL